MDPKTRTLNLTYTPYRSRILNNPSLMLKHVKTIWGDYAVSITIDDGEYAIGGILDYRDEPEGIYFEGNNIKGKIAKEKNIKKYGNNVKPTDRMKELGYMIQKFR